MQYIDFHLSSSYYVLNAFLCRMFKKDKFDFGEIHAGAPQYIPVIIRGVLYFAAQYHYLLSFSFLSSVLKN